MLLSLQTIWKAGFKTKYRFGYLVFYINKIKNAMSNKIKRIIKYLLYALMTNVIYGLILYFVFTWLAGYSLLYAYFWNLAFIIIGLVLDEVNHGLYQSDKFLSEIQSNTLEAKLGKDFLGFYLDAFISFKTILYLFYTVILIFSHINKFYQIFVNEDLVNFIAANEYSILFLIAVDMFIQQFSKDRVRMKKISSKFKKYLTENQDE